MPEKKNPNPTDVHVGSRIRLRRMTLGISQEKLGDNLGISFQQIQKYEKGTNRVGASRLQAIARTLDVAVSFFFEDGPGEAREGSSNAGDVSPVISFLSTSEGLELNRAYLRIGDAKLRRRVLELVRGVAEAGTGAEA